jgi:hypothetical protein
MSDDASLTQSCIDFLPALSNLISSESMHEEIHSSQPGRHNLCVSGLFEIFNRMASTQSRAVIHGKTILKEGNMLVENSQLTVFRDLAFARVVERKASFPSPT